uniref:Uncharacterized protein n=1 Tax=Oxyrrhis marina TaxID=2969 RepID=A0A7S4LNI6_OXYMA
MRVSACTVFAAAAAPEWQVLQKLFSSISIGISFKNDKEGWTSQTDGSSPIQIVKTEDGGNTWNQVKNNTGNHVITLGVAARKGAGITNVATTGALESSEWSVDGETFKGSAGAPVVSQDLKHENGRMVMGMPKGICTSSTGGALYTCHSVPFKYPGTGRYASSPSKDVMYVTAGQWPSNTGRVEEGAETTIHLSKNLRIVHGETRRLEAGLLTDPVNGTYTAELWKSVDGGKTWKNLITDEGNFYFNDVHCFDETNCVAVGEGFAEDSKSPGARVYLTTDGETFKVVHTENAKGTESLMTARMLSKTEHWAGGTSAAGGLTAPALLLHSVDAGSTYKNENNGIVGQMITSVDFVSPTHAYATTVNALQQSSLLEYGGNPTPGPAPGPSPSGPHYEKPPCQAGEVKASVTGSTGSLCAPPCTSGTCPTDVPSGVTASPTCVLQDQSGNKYCALECAKDEECDKAGGSSCSILQGSTGVCTYPDSMGVLMTSSKAVVV